MPAKGRERKSEKNRPLQVDAGPSVIGATLVMKGELTFDEDLLIDGTFIGPISNHSQRLTSSPDAKGNPKNASIVIAGTIDGSVTSDSALYLRRSAKLRGSLHAEDVVVEKGTRLDNTVLSGRVTCSPKRRRKRR